MKNKSILAIGLFVTLCTPSWAIYRCTDSMGKITFQDTVCPGNGQIIKKTTFTDYNQAIAMLSAKKPQEAKGNSPSKRSATAGLALEPGKMMPKSPEFGG